MRFGRVVVFLLLSSVGFASIVDDVRVELAQNNFAGANAKLSAYRSQQGDTPEYIEGLSWMARAALTAKQLDQAEIMLYQRDVH